MLFAYLEIFQPNIENLDSDAPPTPSFPALAALNAHSCLQVAVTGGGGGRSSGGGGRKEVVEKAKSCPRNGQSIKRSSKRVAKGVDGGITKRGKGRGQSARSFTFNPVAAAPSRLIQQETTLQVLSLACSCNHMNWVEGLRQAFRGESWASSQAMATNSLKHIALRCERSQENDIFSTFCRMMNELAFAAKLNR